MKKFWEMGPWPWSPGYSTLEAAVGMLSQSSLHPCAPSGRGWGLEGWLLMEQGAGVKGVPCSRPGCSQSTQVSMDVPALLHGLARLAGAFMASAVCWRRECKSHPGSTEWALDHSGQVESM